MITDADVKKLKESFKDTFPTKEDLVRELKPLKKDVKSIKKSLDETIAHFDKQLNYHHRRLEKLERHADIEPPPYIVLSVPKN